MSTKKTRTSSKARSARAKTKGSPAATEKLRKSALAEIGARLSGKAKPPGKTPPSAAKSASRPKRVSLLDAAAQVLAAAGNPMRAREMVEAVTAKALWSSPKGRTPHATLHAAIGREIKEKGSASRFRKTDRGLFEAAGKGG